MPLLILDNSVRSQMRGANVGTSLGEVLTICKVIFRFHFHIEMKAVTDHLVDTAL